MGTGRSCLELGCGTGLVTMALAHAKASPILATDGNADTTRNCCYNLQLNDISYEGLEVTPSHTWPADYQVSSNVLHLLGRGLQVGYVSTYLKLSCC